jgi:hypothetical protein
VTKARRVTQGLKVRRVSKASLEPMARMAQQVLPVLRVPLGPKVRRVAKVRRSPAGLRPRWSHGRDRHHGVAGPAGPTGPAGPPGVSALELVMATSASNTTTPKIQTVSCPVGKKALGGGLNVQTGATDRNAIQASRPTGGFPPTGRSVTGVTLFGAVTGNWSLTAYVICATVP